MRILLSSVALVSSALAGCSSNGGSDFHRIHVANPRGESIANWIARGNVCRTSENEYRFKAVERFTSPPHPQDIRYPYGRDVLVGGPNMIVSPCGEPLWLYEREGR